MHTLLSKKQITRLTIILLLTVAISCKKNKSDNGGGPPPTPDKVFIAGMWNNTVCYWQDSAHRITYLGEPERGFATGLYISGKTVYVAGTLLVSGYMPGYWTDGARTSLSTITFGGEGFTTGIQVAGSDVYVAGYTLQGGKDVACYWKNGVRTDLSRLQNNQHSRASAICVSGSDVYLAGFTSDVLGAKKACFWKNGERTDLITDNRTYGEVHAIEVSGKTVYTTGFSKKNTDVAEIPCYWTNTNYTALSRSNESTNGKALGMCINGADVYIAGYSYPDDAKMQACFWKNGSRTDLSLPDRADAWASDVQVSGENVYVAGATSIAPDADVPCYWKNGNRVDLGEQGTFRGVASSIFVTK